MLQICGVVLLAIAGLHLYIFGFMIYIKAYSAVLFTGDIQKITDFFAKSIFIPAAVLGCPFLAFKDTRTWIRALPWLERFLCVYAAAVVYGGIYCAVVLGSFLVHRSKSAEPSSEAMTTIKVVWAYILCGSAYAACTLGLPALMYGQYRGFHVLRLSDPEESKKAEEKGSKSKTEKPQEDDAYERMA